MSEKVRELLQRFRQGEATEEEVVQRLVRQPFEEHLLGKFDHLREERTGIPEAILAEGKDPQAVAEIFAQYVAREDQLIATRVTPAIREAVRERLGASFGEIHDYTVARILSVQGPREVAHRPTVLVISAGALDRPVAEEVAVTSRLLGNPTETLWDVGVAGLSRLASHLGALERCGVVVVVAGMDGALPSVVGGLALQPVISVPTSVGYGASFQGLAPLLTMLNSCAPGNAVMNIDNGFGAAVLATKIAQLAARAAQLGGR